MKNRERFKDELIEACMKEVEGRFFDKYIRPYYKCDGWQYFSDEACAILTALWLDEEYEAQEVDWSKVEVDTPILVSTSGQDWIHRHFAEYRDGRVYAFDDGATSWTSNEKIAWLYAKLAELQKPEHDSCGGCKFEHFGSDQEPCKDCQYAYIDQYEPKE